jgi:hypothetical protein
LWYAFYVIKEKNNFMQPKIKQSTEIVTFHFDLRDAVSAKQFHFHVGADKYELKEHTAETRAYYRTKNKALALLSDEQMEAVTHFVEDVEVPSDLARVVNVTCPSENKAHNIPTLVLTAVHLPRATREKHRREKFAKTKVTSHVKLAYLGVKDPLPEEDLVAIYNDADTYLTPLDAAKSVVFHHPQLASRNPDTATIVMDDHIDGAPGLYALATKISEQGAGHWAETRNSVDKDGKTLTWGGDYPNHKAGEPVQHYKLSDETLQATGSPLKGALKTSQDDEGLKDKKWTVNQGITNVDRHTNVVPAPETILAAVKDTAGYTFTLKNLTPGYGLDIYKDSIAYNPGATPKDPGSFSIQVKNTHLKTLSSYYQFTNDKGIPLPNAKKDYISSVTAVNVILGIPMPTDPTTLAFRWPEEATSCRLLFGCLGTSRWDGDVDPHGLILTGVFQYGIPSLFLAAGAAIESNAWFKEFCSDTDNIMAVIAVAFPIVGGGVATAAALLNTKMVLFAFADAIAGIIVHQGLKKLAAYITEKLAAAELEEAIPYVGWIFAVANRLVDVGEMIETTIEVLVSPATYEAHIRRRMAMQVTVHPDPLHGTEPQDAVWPEVANHYLVLVQYKDGTNYSLTGELDATTSSAPIVVLFPDLPAGEQCQVSCGVYSKTDWLAGKWMSAWIDAMPPTDGSGVLKVEGSIQENLVPLTSQTQYSHKEKLVYDTAAKKHAWLAGNQPTALVGDLDSSNIGNNLAKLVNITINNKAYMLGYCWQASGQNLPFCGTSEPTTGQIYAFQNINVLADPEVSLKFPNCGFGNQPYIGYDQFGPAPLFSLPNSAEADLDAGNVSDGIKDIFKRSNYELPSDAQVIVKTATAEWFIGQPKKDPAYDLRREPDGSISVFTYPTPAFSPNNFYLDPRNNEYHLRLITLDDKTPFDMSPTLSWGRFNEPHMDAFIVHPMGFVIGVSWMNHKMEILKIPEAGVPDDKAEIAVPVSGEGVRQGLLRGPIAITVAADGRVLILETTNQRIQSFDIHGNPVPSFDGPAIVSLDKAYAADLNRGLATVELRQQFQANGATLSSDWLILDGDAKYQIKLTDKNLNVTRDGAALSNQWVISDDQNSYDVRVNGEQLTVSVGGIDKFNLPLSNEAVLNRGSVSAEIVQAFKDNGITLSQQAAVSGNGLQLDLSCEKDLARGAISKEVRAAFTTRNISLSDQATLSSSVGVTVKKQDALWVLKDQDTNQSYKIALNTDTKKLDAVFYHATMPLHVPDPAVKITYLDMATEMKGYIYVLAYTGEGKDISDYYLDIYEPSGRWLSRTPDTSIDPEAKGVNAAKLAVDMWRNMLTLNFEHFQGPNDRTEPSVSNWIPSTPKGDRP